MKNVTLYNKNGEVLNVNDSELDVDDGTDGDLELADSFGNILVRFAHGHIKTKYFDSSKIGSSSSSSSSTSNGITLTKIY